MTKGTLTPKDRQRKINSLVRSLKALELQRDKIEQEIVNVKARLAEAENGRTNLTAGEHDQ